MFESQDESFNIKFVRAVEKYPELYDFTRSDYSKKEVTQKAWSEIAKEFQLSESECKERWRNFRTLYVRHTKAAKNKSKTNFKRPYYLGNVMKFLTPFIKGNGNLLPTFIEDSGVTIKRDCSDLNKPSAHTTPPLSQPTNACEESKFKGQDSKLTPEAECREKWKYFRIIFSRDLKKPETYAGTRFRRRPHYLSKDMQFLLPFMKISTSKQKSQGIPVNDSEVIVQLECSKLNNQSVNSSQPANSPQHAKIQDSPCLQSNYKKINFNIKDNIKNTDKALFEYSAAKKPKLIRTEVFTPPTYNKKEAALQQFLNSLIPDLMAMTDTQLRAYKQNTILLIDEILGTAPVEVYCTQELSTGISLNIPQSLKPDTETETDFKST